MMINPMSLGYLTQPLDIKTIFLILPNIMSKEWSNKFFPTELQLSKANISDTKALFLDLHSPISKRFVSSKIYDKHDDFQTRQAL